MVAEWQSESEKLTFVKGGHENARYKKTRQNNSA